MRVIDNHGNAREVTGAIEQAYNALETAAERIGANNYKNGLYRVKRDRKGRVISGYTITAEHAAIVEAMPRVLSGELSPESAFAMLHEYDVLKQRLDTSKPWGEL